MFKITFDLSITGLVSLAVAGVSLIVAHTSKKKLNRVCDKLDIAHDKIMDKDFNLEGYVTQKVIEDVVRDRAAKEVDYQVRPIAKEALKHSDTIFEKRIQTEVNEQYEDTRAMVKEALKEKVGAIDISDVKKEVIQDAKREALSKLDSDLDVIRESYNKQIKTQVETLASLGNMTKSFVKGVI